MTSPLPHFFGVLESQLGLKKTNLSFNINENSYIFEGVNVGDTFISNPILDFCSYRLIDGMSENTETDYEIKVSDYFGPFGLPKENLEPSNKVFFVLDTYKDYGGYLSRLKSKTRSQLSNIKYDYKFEISNSPSSEDIDSFYDLYIKKMRSLASLPLPKSFFETLIGTGDGVIIAHAKLGDKVGASACMLLINKVLHIVWAASDNKNSINLFLYREIINYCFDHSEINAFNFGRATEYSTQYNFKKQFSAGEYRIFRLTNKKVSSYRYEKARALISPIYQLLPFFLVKQLGKFFIRYCIR